MLISQADFKLSVHVHTQSVFTITVQDGNNTIQNGGDTPRPSIRSILTINRPNRAREGSYVCSVSGDFSDLRTITLQVMEGKFQ